MLLNCKTVKGYARYQTDGVHVYRYGKKQRVYPQGYHLVRDGETVFDFVPVDKALGKAKAKKKTAKAKK